ESLCRRAQGREYEGPGRASRGCQEGRADARSSRALAATAAGTAAAPTAAAAASAAAEAAAREVPVAAAHHEQKGQHLVQEVGRAALLVLEEVLEVVRQRRDRGGDVVVGRGSAGHGLE